MQTCFYNDPSAGPDRVQPVASGSLTDEAQLQDAWIRLHVFVVDRKAAFGTELLCVFVKHAFVFAYTRTGF